MVNLKGISSLLFLDVMKLIEALTSRLMDLPSWRIPRGGRTSSRCHLGSCDGFCHRCAWARNERGDLDAWHAWSLGQVKFSYIDLHMIYCTYDLICHIVFQVSPSECQVIWKTGFPYNLKKSLRRRSSNLPKDAEIFSTDKLKKVTPKKSHPNPRTFWDCEDWTGSPFRSLRVAQKEKRKIHRPISCCCKILPLFATGSPWRGGCGWGLQGGGWRLALSIAAWHRYLQLF